jgi:hypothetical protein
MNSQKITCKEAIIFVFAILLISNVSAANIGVSPASLKFENVLRGGYSEETIVITVDSLEPINVEISSREEVGGWMNFSVSNFTVTKDNPYFLKVTINPPDDTPNGNYTGFLRLMTSGFGGGIEGHAVGIIRSALDLSITAEVTDIEVVECSATNFKVNSVEKGDDVVFSFRIANNGNIKLNPRVTVDIWDQDQISIVKSQEFTEKDILPTIEDNFEVRIKSEELDLGQYWADISVIDCYDSQTLTFDILEPGALKAEGVLLNILTKKEAEVDETVPIEIGFKNTGEKEVEAQFKGKVTLGEKIIQVLETEKLNVPISEIGKFNLFFTPKKEGRYVISGRVFYSGKKTFESSAVLNVFSKKLKLSSVIAPLVYIVLIFFIAVLFYKIRKERRAYLNKLKRLRK